MSVTIDEVHAEIIDDRPAPNGTGKEQGAPKQPPQEALWEQQYQEWQRAVRRDARLQEW